MASSGRRREAKARRREAKVRRRAGSEDGDEDEDEDEDGDGGESVADNQPLQAEAIG